MKKISLWIVLVLSMIGIPTFVYAQDDAFYAGDTVKINENVNTTLFAAGEKVIVDSNVDGMCFLAGNSVKVSGTQDYLFSAGKKLEVNKVNAKDVFLAGKTITVKNSSIRDLYIAGDTIKIDTDVTNNVYAGGDIIKINGNIYGDVDVAASKIYIGKNAHIYGTLKYPKKAKVKIANTAVVGKQQAYKSSESRFANISTFSHIKSLIVSAITMIIIGLILKKLFPKMFKFFNDQEHSTKEIFKTLGIGFLLLICVPIAALVMIITIIGIPISLILIVLYALLIYLTAIPTASFIGTWLAKDKVKNEYVLLSLSIFGLYVLRMIPYIRGLVTFATLLFGLGSYVLLMKKNFTKKKK